ncbi:MAG: hypothetical protein ACRDZY_22760 [Acidimicrobiales bacterium]
MIGVSDRWVVGPHGRRYRLVPRRANANPEFIARRFARVYVPLVVDLLIDLYRTLRGGDPLGRAWEIAVYRQWAEWIVAADTGDNPQHAMDTLAALIQAGALTGVPTGTRLSLRAMREPS